MSRIFEIFTDGACSGNPGEAGIGVVIFEKEKPIKRLSESIGEATNNIAEYAALIYALQEALMLKGDQVKVNTDSQLMCSQVRGTYKIKEPSLKFLHGLVGHLIKGFKSFEIQYIPRERNKDADKLATKAITVRKKEQAKVVAPTLFDVGEESPSSKG